MEAWSTSASFAKKKGFLAAKLTLELFGICTGFIQEKVLPSSTSDVLGEIALVNAEDTLPNQILTVGVALSICSMSHLFPSFFLIVCILVSGSSACDIWPSSDHTASPEQLQSFAQSGYHMHPISADFPCFTTHLLLVPMLLSRTMTMCAAKRAGWTL